MVADLATVEAALRDEIRRDPEVVAAPMALMLIFPTPKATATPYFAQQTGQQCSFCHMGAPTANGAYELNPTGLAFKNNGFSFGQPGVPQQQLCSLQNMPLFDRAGNFRGNFNVRVCN